MGEGEAVVGAAVMVSVVVNRCSSSGGGGGRGGISQNSDSSVVLYQREDSLVLNLDLDFFRRGRNCRWMVFIFLICGARE